MSVSKRLGLLLQSPKSNIVAIILASAIGYMLIRRGGLHWALAETDAYVLLETTAFLLFPVSLLTWISGRVFPKIRLLICVFVPIFWIVSQPYILILSILITGQPWEGYVSKESEMIALVTSTVLGLLAFLMPSFLILILRRFIDG